MKAEGHNHQSKMAHIACTVDIPRCILFHRRKCLCSIFRRRTEPHLKPYGSSSRRRINYIITPQTPLTHTETLSTRSCRLESVSSQHNITNLTYLEHPTQGCHTPRTGVSNLDGHSRRCLKTSPATQGNYQPTYSVASLAAPTLTRSLFGGRPPRARRLRREPRLKAHTPSVAGTVQWISHPEISH